MTEISGIPAYNSYKNNRPVLLRAVHALKLASMTEENALWKAWSVLRDKRNRRADYLDWEDVPLSFARKRWLDFLRHPNDPKKIDRRQLEVGVLTHLSDHWQSGTVFVPGAEAFAHHQAELLPWRECERQLKEHCEPDRSPRDYRRVHRTDPAAHDGDRGAGGSAISAK